MFAVKTAMRYCSSPAANETKCTEYDSFGLELHIVMKQCFGKIGIFCRGLIASPARVASTRKPRQRVVKSLSSRAIDATVSVAISASQMATQLMTVPLLERVIVVCGAHHVFDIVCS